MVGINCGPVRRPISPVAQKQVEDLRRRLDEMGWFHWV